MKKKLLSMLMLFPISTYAQSVISGHIKNYEAGIKVMITPAFDSWLYASDRLEVLPDADGNFTIKANTLYPQFIVLDYKSIHLKLYTEPFKTLKLAFNAADCFNTLSFSKSLAKENLFCLQTGITNFDLYPHQANDTALSPVDIFQQIQLAQNISLKKLDSITKFVNTSFVNITKAEIDYYAAAKLLELSFKAGVWWAGEAAKPVKYSLSTWKEVIYKAYSANPLSNSLAVNSYNYMAVVNNINFYLECQFVSKTDFAAEFEKIMGEPLGEIKATLGKKGKSYLEYKQLCYYINGPALEKSIASFIKRQIEQGNLECIDEVYSFFISRFKSGMNVKYVEKAMGPYFESVRDKSGKERIFITDTTISFGQIVDQFTGKVVYVDVWGTWCPSCRKAFLSAPLLKERFRNKPVVFLYIAYEHGPAPEKNWRNTIRFFKLDGTHVLANNKMRQYLESAYKDGLKFPAYMLIDKSGSVVNTNPASPGSEEMIKQIDALL